jgi:hypothetical protein
MKKNKPKDTTVKKQEKDKFIKLTDLTKAKLYKKVTDKSTKSSILQTNFVNVH